MQGYEPVVINESHKPKTDVEKKKTDKKEKRRSLKVISVMV